MKTTCKWVNFQYSCISSQKEPLRGVLKYAVKILGKYLWRSSIFSKVAENFTLNRLLNRYFSRILAANFTWQLLGQLFLRTLFFRTPPVAALHLLLKKWASNRSSRPEVFCKKGAFRNFAKFAGKHLCQRKYLTHFCKKQHHRYFTGL